MTYLQGIIDTFRTETLLLLKDFVLPGEIEESEIYEDYGILSYNLVEPMSLQALADQIQAIMWIKLCYILKPSDYVNFGWKICAYSVEGQYRMFKINAVTDDNGMIHSIDFTLYSSLEIMATDLFEEIERVRTAGTFEEIRNNALIIADFF